jgi:hypothetical protein
MGSSKVSIIFIIGILAIAPPIFDRIFSERQRQQDARDDELVKKYECYPLDTCAADFNEDGLPARFEVARTYPVSGDLIVIDGNKEVLRLTYDHTDRTLRTHTAICRENDKTHLLIYDGASQKPPLRAVYEWDGEKLVGVKPAGIEAEILSAMAAYDDTGGWNDRTVFRPIKRMLYLGAYYVVFIVSVGIALYKKLRRSSRDAADSTGNTSPRHAV